jgi:hypothetical protein
MVKRKQGLVVVLVSAAVVAGLWLSAGSLASPQRPIPCTASGTRSLVFAFVRAFNAGDRPALNRLWAKGAHFRWYSAYQNEPRMGDTVYFRARLLSYFGTRHLQQERMKVVRFHFGGKGFGFGYGHFDYRLEREALDLSATSRVYDGKGAVACYTRPRALAVWSMSTV